MIDAMRQPNPVAKFAAMSDEQLFNPQVYYEGEGDALKAERAKRQRAKDEEQQRLDDERATRIQQHKEAITYSDKLAQEICERVSAGELSILICNEERMPTVRRCNQWLKQVPEFNQLYQSAINDRLNIFEEEVIKIADDMKNDFRKVIKNGVEKRVADPEMVARAKLRIEVRFRHLKALRPQRWAEQSTLNVKNSDEFDPASFSAEQLESEIASIEMKSRITKAA